MTAKSEDLDMALRVQLLIASQDIGDPAGAERMVERIAGAMMCARVSEREACANIARHQTTRTSDETALIERIEAAIRSRSTLKG